MWLVARAGAAELWHATHGRERMNVAPGSRLGPHELTQLLGAGGPASARDDEYRELRRGLALPKERRWR
jgi:hypothetical protein